MFAAVVVEVLVVVQPELQQELHLRQEKGALTILQVLQERHRFAELPIKHNRAAATLMEHQVGRVQTLVRLTRMAGLVVQEKNGVVTGRVPVVGQVSVKPVVVVGTEALVVCTEAVGEPVDITSETVVMAQTELL